LAAATLLLLAAPVGAQEPPPVPKIDCDPAHYCELGAAGCPGPGLTALSGRIIVGTEENDKLRGTDKDDLIVGLGGNDSISGHGGDDVLCGGEGKDHIHG